MHLTSMQLAARDRIVRVFEDAAVIDPGSGCVIHYALAEIAWEAQFEPGENNWLSLTAHAVTDGSPLLARASKVGVMVLVAGAIVPVVHTEDLRRRRLQPRTPLHRMQELLDVHTRFLARHRYPSVDPASIGTLAPASPAHAAWVCAFERAWTGLMTEMAGTPDGGELTE